MIVGPPEIRCDVLLPGDPDEELKWSWLQEDWAAIERRFSDPAGPYLCEMWRHHVPVRDFRCRDLRGFEAAVRDLTARYGGSCAAVAA